MFIEYRRIKSSVSEEKSVDNFQICKFLKRMKILINMIGVHMQTLSKNKKEITKKTYPFLFYQFLKSIILHILYKKAIIYLLI